MDTNINNAAWMARRSLAVARGVSQTHPVFAAKAHNSTIWDVDGNQYIDFAGGIAVLNTGHSHPTIIAAVEAQLRKFTHTCFQVVAYDLYVEVCERLNKLAPGDFQKKSLLVTTGAEALENAVKIARAATRRSAVICFSGGYHGRTLMTLGMTGKVNPYKTGFGPFPPEVFHARFPSALLGASVDDSMLSIDELFRNDVDPHDVAAIVVEPVQGEGGFYVAPPAFLQRLRLLCDQYGMLLIADEVQTGAGRTGKWFAMEHSGVIPDLTTTAKSFAGGFPLAAVVGRADVMDAPSPGGLGGTYAGNPLACAAALAVLDIFEKERLLERSAHIGLRITARLCALQQRVPEIAEVRGLGAMVAIEFRRDNAPNADLAKAVVTEALRRGLILLSCGVYGNVVRLLMPLTIPDAELEEGLSRLETAVLQAISRAPSPAAA